MNDFVIHDGKTTFTRISKVAARKIFNEGRPITLCPVKLRPGYPFAPHCRVFPDLKNCGFAGLDSLNQLFDRYVNEFTFYNCNINETGYYPAFYTETYKD